MIFRTRSWLILLALVAVFPAAAQEAIKARLAEPPLPEGWTREGDIAVYDEKTLFELINGEAELYFPYRFQFCYEAAYVSASDAELSYAAEVYEMGSHLDAFGIYSNYRDVDEEFIAVGAQGFIGSTQIIFYQDRCFVKLREAGKLREDKDTLLAMAKAISQALPANTPPPPQLWALRFMQRAGIVPNTEKYTARSLLGYDFFQRGLAARAAMSEEGETRVFAVFHDSADAAKQTLDKYVAYLDEFEGEHEWRDTVLLVKDPLHKGVLVQQVGANIVGVAGPGGAAEGLGLLGTMQVQQELARLKSVEELREKDTAKSAELCAKLGELQGRVNDVARQRAEEVERNQRDLAELQERLGQLQLLLRQ